MRATTNNRYDSDRVEVMGNDGSVTSSHTSQRSDIVLPRYPGLIWNEFGNVPRTVNFLLRCGAHATAVHKKQSAAYMALDWCIYNGQADAFLPFIRHGTTIPRDAVGLYEEIITRYTERYVRDMANLDVNRQYNNDDSRRSSFIPFDKSARRPPLYVRKIAAELLLNHENTESLSEELSKMVLLSSRFVTNQSGPVSNVPGKGFAETLAFAVKSDRHQMVADLLADARFQIENPKELLFGKQKNTCMHLAAYEASENVLKLLIQHGFDIDARNSEGLTPLSLCGHGGHIVVARILLEAGADSTIGDLRGNDTIWHLAARKGPLEILETLIRYDTRKDSALKIVTTNDAATTPVAEALRCGSGVSAARLLTECPRDPAYFSSATSVLYYAAEMGSMWIFEKLLEKGIDPHQHNSENSTPLHAVSLNVDPKFIRYLTTIYDIHSRTTYGLFPIMSVLSSLDLNIHIITSGIQLMLDDQIIDTLNAEGNGLWEYFCDTILPDFDDYTPRFAAHIIGALVKLLMRARVLERYEAHSGSSAVLPMLKALLPVSYWANPSLISTIMLVLDATTKLQSIRTHELSVKLLEKLMESQDFNATKHALSKGINVHVPGARGVSVLQRASSLPLKLDIFGAIIHHADKEKLNDIFPSGESIIHCLLRRKVNDRTRKIDIVLSNGFNPKISGRYQYKTPAVVLAARNGDFDIVSRILDHTGSPDLADTAGINIMVWAIKHGNLHMVHRLRQAIESNHSWAQEFFFLISNPDHDGPAHFEDRGNYLHLASSFGETDIIEYFLREDLTEINSVSRRERFTALHIAVLGHFRDAAVVLLDRGANINAKDAFHKIPLDWALIAGDVDIARLLLVHGSDLGCYSSCTRSRIRQLMANPVPELIKKNSKYQRLMFEFAILADDLERCQQIVRDYKLELRSITMASCNACNPLTYAAVTCPGPSIPQWLFGE